MYSMVQEPHLTVLFSHTYGKGIWTGIGGARVIEKRKAIMCRVHREFDLLNAEQLMLRSVITALGAGTKEEREIIVSDKG